MLVRTRGFLLRMALITLMAGSDVFAAETKQRAAVPSADEQTQALALIQDIFKTEYRSREPSERLAFAKTLLKQAAETSEPAAKFVLLNEAGRVAASAGEPQLALEACDTLIERFDVSPIATRIDALTPLATSAKLPTPVARMIMDAAERTMEQAIRLGDFDAAARCAALAEKAAIKTKDSAILADIRKRKAEVATTRKLFEKFLAFEKVLATTPDDADASLGTGTYLCLVIEDWDKGLPRLVKGSDPQLAALAQESLKKPGDAKEQATLANQWWDMGEKLDASQRDAARRHAAGWYGLAVGNLTGLPKSIAEKRLAELPHGPAPRQLARPVNLVDLIDLKQDTVRGEWAIDKGILRCTRGGLVPKVVVPYEPPEEYDVTFAFSQPAFRNALGVSLPNRNGGVFCAYLLEDRGISYGISVDGKVGRQNPTNRVYPGAAQPNQKYTAVVQVRRNSVKLLVNDKLLTAYEGDFSALKADSWRDSKATSAVTVFCDDPTDFYSIDLREVSGPGKKLR